MSMIHPRDDGNGASRHFDVRDLRFAGTVAAGLVAGVLGVGALTAPLLGWTQWPSAPGQPETTKVTLRPTVETKTSPASKSPAGTPGATPGIVVPVAGGTSVAPPPAGRPASSRAPAARTGTGGGTPTTRTSVTGGAGTSQSGAPVSGLGATSASNNADSDHDGMPDFYEMANGLDPAVADAGADKDGDGVSNLNEYKLRVLDPALGNANSGASDDGIPDGERDSDGDGITDAIETETGTDPTTPATDGTPDATKDTDGDGVSDLDEQNAGTDPLVADQPVAPPSDSGTTTPPPPSDTPPSGDNPQGTQPDPVHVQDPDGDGHSGGGGDDG